MPETVVFILTTGAQYSHQQLFDKEWSGIMLDVTNLLVDLHNNEHVDPAHIELLTTLNDSGPYGVRVGEKMVLFELNHEPDDQNKCDLMIFPVSNFDGLTQPLSAWTSVKPLSEWTEAEFWAKIRSLLTRDTQMELCET